LREDKTYMYDFTSIVKREGASKWDDMRRRNPDVPPDIVPFSVADMEFRPATEISEELAEYARRTLPGYTWPTAAYYEAVQGWMKRRHGWDVEKDWIVTAAGVIPVLFTAVRALTERGDGVIIFSPVYRPFYDAVERNGRKVVTSDLVVDRGRYVMDYDDLERKAKDRTNRLLLLSSPHNPVGRVWERGELERLGKICLENGIPVVSDEIHFDLVLPGHRHTVFATICEEFAGNSIVCTAPSKTFNLAGLQTSNIVIKNNKLKEAYLEALRRSGYSTQLNVFGYRACETAYTRCETWLDELLGVIERNRKTAEDAILGKNGKNGIEGIEITPLEGTYLQWWDCRGLGMGHHELETFMTREALFFASEGYVFGKNGRGYERVNLACPAAILETALERLASAVRNRPQAYFFCQDSVSLS
jgi:putative C-S lyase